MAVMAFSPVKNVSMMSYFRLYQLSLELKMFVDISCRDRELGARTVIELLIACCLFSQLYDLINVKMSKQFWMMPRNSRNTWRRFGWSQERRQ